MSVLFSGPSPHGSLRCAVPAVSGAGHDSDAQGRPDQQFVAMLNTYRSNGGLARAEEVLTIFGHAPGFDVATLARWILERK